MDTDFSTLHEQMIVVDGHCDTILELYHKKRSFWDYNKEGHVDWPRLQAGKVNLQFFAFYIEPEYKPSGALSRVLELLAYFQDLRQDQKDKLSLILSQEDIKKLHPHAASALLAIEGGEVLEGKASALRFLFQLGFRSMTLTWNQRNQLADGAWEKENKGGLSVLGRQVVQEMNTLGMLIDVSHLNEAGFWDVLSRTQRPVAATHSCCRALKEHPRNLSNGQLRALRDNGGVIGINFYPGFLGQTPCTLLRVAEHLEHAASVAGIDHVGLGSDFDGISLTPQGLSSAADFPCLTEVLIKRGWKQEEVAKAMGGNFIRVLQNVLPQSPALQN